MPAGRPPKYTNPADMQIEIDKYFADCDKGEVIEKFNKHGDPVSITRQIPYTVIGLTLALGFCSRQSFFDYIERDNGNNDFSDTIKRAKGRIEQQRNLMLLDGRNPVGSIFDLKNNFNWVDRTEISAVYRDETVDPESLAMVRAMALQLARGQQPKQIEQGKDDSDPD